MKVVPGLLLILALFAPLAAAQGGLIPVPVTHVCGTVVNEAGWALEDVQVTAQGTGSVSLLHLPPPQAVTDENGEFILPIVHDTYLLLFEDDDPEARAGAVYTPTTARIDGADDDQLVTGGCAMEDDEQAIEIGNVELPAPGVEFFEVHAHDKAPEKPLPGADAVVEILDVALAGLEEWGAATTDGNGTARLSCPAGLPFQVRVEKTHYQDAASTNHQCGETGALLEVDVWREARNVTGTVRDGNTKEPLEGAEVTFSAQGFTNLDGPGYVLGNETDPDGAYTVSVPWGDRYDVVAEKDGYTQEQDQIEVDLDPLDPLDLDLERLIHTFADQVVDVHGQAYSANLTIEGDPLGEPIDNEPTDPDGSFSHTLPFGTYTLTIQAVDKNNRTCTLQIQSDGAFELEPTRCLSLIATGKAAVEGRVLDEPTTDAVEKAEIEIGDDARDTGKDGRFVIEVDPDSTSYKVLHPAYEDKTDDLEIDGPDTFFDLGDLPLDRTPVPVEFLITDDGSGDGLNKVRVDVEHGVWSGHGCTTGSTGTCTIPLEWTQNGGRHTVAGYNATAKRTTEAPLYDLQDCVRDLRVDFVDSFDGIQVPCRLQSVPGLETRIGPLLDAHDGSFIDGATVEAVLQSGEEADGRLTQDAVGLDVPVCGSPYSCRTTTNEEGLAVLQLPEGRGFTVRISSDAYQPINGTVPAGGTFFENETLLRTITVVDVELRDAHTDGDIEGASLQATGDGFECAVDPLFTCEASTNQTGQAALELPWGDHRLDVLEGEHTVHADFEEEGVRFPGTRRTIPIGPEDPPAIPQTFRLVRAPGETITGNVTDFQGDIVPGTTLTPTSLRTDPFACNPDPDGSGGAFPDCDGISAQGNYTLVLPHGTLDAHEWDLLVEHEDHFNENRVVEPGNEQDFVLWPLRFDFTLEVRDVQTDEPVRFVDACIKNLERTTPGNAVNFDDCGQNGAQRVPIDFADLRWIRDGEEDTTDPFLVRVLAPQYAPQTLVLEAGPAENHAVVHLVPVVPGVPEPDFAPGRIHGNVTDLNATAQDEVTGILLTAVRQDGPCPNGLDTFPSASIAGTYELLVSCPGTYLLEAEDPAGRYVPTNAEVVVPEGDELLPGIAGLPGEAEQDLELERTTSPVEVQVLDAATQEGVEGANVTLEGLDVAFEAGPETTDSTGTARFEVPWGAYEAAAVADEPDWLVSSGNTILTALSGVQGEGMILLASLEGEVGCAPEAGPQLCGPGASDRGVELRSIATRGGETGSWKVSQPQLGSVVSEDSSATVNPVAGPHDGTWIIQFQPDPIQSGPSSVEVDIHYSKDGVSKTLSATTSVIAAPGGQFHYNPLVWMVNLHTEGPVTCAPVANTCPDADPAGAGQARLFLPE